MTNHEWRCHVAPDYSSFVLGLHTIYLANHRGDGHTDILGADGQLHTVPEHLAIDFELPHLPLEAIQAIAEAVKPGPTQETIDALREALAVERARVDRVIGYAIEAPEGITR